MGFSVFRIGPTSAPPPGAVDVSWADGTESVGRGGVLPVPGSGSTDPRGRTVLAASPGRTPEPATGTALAKDKSLPESVAPWAMILGSVAGETCGVTTGFRPGGVRFEPAAFCHSRRTQLYP